MELSQIKTAIQETFPDAQIEETNEHENYLTVSLRGLEFLVREEEYDGHYEDHETWCTIDWGADFDSLEELIDYINIDIKRCIEGDDSDD